MSRSGSSSFWPIASTSSGASSVSPSRRSRATRRSARRRPSSSASPRTSTPARRWRASLSRCPRELEPLTTKPLLEVVNGPKGIDLKLESELAELSETARPPRSAEALGAGGGGRGACSSRSTWSASSRRARRRRGPGRCTRRPTALDAAAAVHTDLAQRLHSCRGDPLGRSRRVRLPRRGGPTRPPAARGQGLRRRGRRRPQHQVFASS